LYGYKGEGDNKSKAVLTTSLMIVTTQKETTKNDDDERRSVNPQRIEKRCPERKNRREKKEEVPRRPRFGMRVCARAWKTKGMGTKEARKQDEECVCDCQWGMRVVS
jgi:hypothetical protein